MGGDSKKHGCVITYNIYYNVLMHSDLHYDITVIVVAITVIARSITIFVGAITVTTTTVIDSQFMLSSLGPP